MKTPEDKEFYEMCKPLPKGSRNTEQDSRNAQRKQRCHECQHAFDVPFTTLKMCAMHQKRWCHTVDVCPIGREAE